MSEWTILAMVFASATGAGHSAVKMLLFNKSYEERVLSAMGLESGRVDVVDTARLYHLTVFLSITMFLLGLLFGGANIFGGVIFGLVMAVPMFFIPPTVVSHLTSKRLEKINEELPSTLEILSSSMFAGLTLVQAISRNIDKMPSTIAEEFRIVANECRLGSSLNEALKNWARRNDLMDVKLTVIAAELSLRHGGDMPSTFRKLAATIRERYMFKKEVQTLTTEGRMQAIIMTLLPFAILIIMTLIRHEVMLAFLASPIGFVSVGLVIAMQVTAYFWIKNTVTIEV